MTSHVRAAARLAPLVLPTDLRTLIMHSGICGRRVRISGRGLLRTMCKSRLIRHRHSPNVDPSSLMMNYILLRKQCCQFKRSERITPRSTVPAKFDTKKFADIHKFTSSFRLTGYFPCIENSFFHVYILPVFFLLQTFLPLYPKSLLGHSLCHWWVPAAISIGHSQVWHY